MLWSGGKALFIIGCGFRDRHINQVLLKGVKEHGLRIYIISPEPYPDLKSRMTNGHYYALPILAGLHGYSPYSLRDIFPPDQSETVHFRQIRHALHSAS